MDNAHIHMHQHARTVHTDRGVCTVVVTHIFCYYTHTVCIQASTHALFHSVKDNILQHTRNHRDYFHGNS